MYQVGLITNTLITSKINWDKDISIKFENIIQ